MHRQNPLSAAFVGYSGGGARSLVDVANDMTGMQEMKGAFMSSEARDRIESPQNYGFTSVVRAATKDAMGKIKDCAEAYISFMGGNRSFPVAGIMDDRRHRPWGLKEGENAQYDDLGQMTLMRRAGLFLLSLDGPDDSQKQQGAAGGKDASGGGGGQQQNVERMVSMRHVEKKKQPRPQKQEQGGQGGSGGGSGGAGAGTLSVEAQAAAAANKQNGSDFKHEGESVNTEIRCTKNRIEFRSGDSVVGYYDKGADTWYFKGKIVSIENTERFETFGDGKTYLGLDKKGEGGPRVGTELGFAKKTFAKVS
jgi:hypothetical protein